MALKNTSFISKSTSNRPWLIIIAAVLIALNTLRIAALTFALRAAAGTIPPTFLVSGVGDFLAGITAPVVAWLLIRRPSFASWLAGVVWIVYSFADFVFVNSANYLATGLVPNNSGALVPAGPTYLLSLLAFVTVTHMAMFMLLSMPRVRAYVGVGQTDRRGWTPEQVDKPA